MSKKLDVLWEQAHGKYPYLTKENFFRISLLYDFVSYNGQTSYPDPFSRIEVIFSPKTITKTDILDLLRPNSPFQIVDVGPSQKILLYENEFVDMVGEYEQALYNMKAKEPLYFYVREIRGELVLKLNPIQLCDFFQNPRGEQPCSFCFRNDMVSRFRNTTTADLVKTIVTEEKKNNYALLKDVEEISIITGSYKNDEDYVKEVGALVKGLLPYVRKGCRVVVGSHEGKGAKTFEMLKKAGVTVFAFPLESLDDTIRLTKMKNRKGKIPIKDLVSDIKEAIDIFGDDGVIIRTVAGMGDALDTKFRNVVSSIAGMGSKGPLWNVNIYTPFTHYHWRLFNQNRGFTKDYLFNYMNIVNEYVPKDRYWNFKISP